MRWHEGVAVGLALACCGDNRKLAPDASVPDAGIDAAQCSTADDCPVVSCSTVRCQNGACIAVNQSACAMPFCALGASCATWLDSDGDGLSDAWEINGYVDLDCNGAYDGPAIDIPLPGADPHVPDIYVRYDYMAVSGPGGHSHEPSAAALAQVTAAFAAHGIAVHFIAPPAAIPETVVTTLDAAPSAACAGSSVSTMHDLRAAYFGNLQPAYRYMVFAHFATCPDTGHCGQCTPDPSTGSTPDPTSTGSADIVGDDVIIASANIAAIEQLAGTIMHELGHNLGLRHGGNEDTNQKPNYVSVMNYAYLANGIPVADAVGSTTPLACASDGDCAPPTIASGPCAIADRCFCSSASYCYRVDYSHVLFGDLDEAHLDEAVGMTGDVTSRDIALYFVPGTPTVELLDATNGSPVDWNNANGNTEPDVAVDLNNSGNPDLLHSFVDWPALQLPYQCSVLAGR